MNYIAPRPKRLKKIKEPTVFNLIMELYNSFTLFIDLLIQFPLSILEKLGLNIMPNLISLNLPLCSLCMCCSLLGMTSSIGVALGVGLGVGLNCRETQYFYTNNLSNFTNSTNFTDSSDFSTLSNLSNSSDFSTLSTIVTSSTSDNSSVFSTLSTTITSSTSANSTGF